MTPEQTIKSLLALATENVKDEEAEEAAARVVARMLWARKTVAALLDAQERVKEAWSRTFADLPDDLDEEELDELDLPDPPEQAEVDALYAQLQAVREKDMWPRELYWSL